MGTQQGIVMNKKIFLNKWAAVILLLVCSVVSMAAKPIAAAKDPLPSWRGSAAKTAIVTFVKAVTDLQSADYVQPAARIAVFDNDGTNL